MKKKLAQKHPSRKASTYALVITLSENVRPKVGKLGWCYFSKGTYVYAGSARRGFDSRIKRHLSKKKRLHWHVDYLLSSEYATVKEVWAFPDDIPECGLPTALVFIKLGKVVVRGFGATDCRHGCPAHLVKVTGSIGDAFEKMGGWRYRGLA